MAHSYADARKTYSVVLGALLVLTAITVLAAGVNFGSPSVNIVVALGIASVKGSLVALYFMHLKYESPVNAIIFVTGLAMLALFLVLCLVDVDTRTPIRPANLAPPAGSSQTVETPPATPAGEASEAH
jgi:cytochrome c oxidase subunit 4